MVVIQLGITMREYILTKKDRQTIKVYLEKDLKLNGFGVLRIRVKRAIPILEKDIELLRKFIQKLKENEE